MQDNILAKTLFTVHSEKEGIFGYERNRRFLVDAGRHNYADNHLNSERAIPADDDTENGTPVQVALLGFEIEALYTLRAKQRIITTDAKCGSARQIRPPSFLRFTMDDIHHPEDPEAGFVFGCDDTCDVWLDERCTNGISRRQFAVKLNWETGCLDLENLSKQGTCVGFDDSKPKYTMTEMPLLTGALQVAFGDRSILIRVPNHDDHQDQFFKNWSEYHAKLSSQVPGLQALGIASQGPTKTSHQTRYVFGPEIARGYQGIVYQAYDVVDQEYRAIKDFHQDNRHNRQEVELVCSLDHKHIIKSRPYFASPYGPPMLAMEFINGPNFAESQKCNPLNCVQFREALRQMLDAMAYFHPLGVTHRDIKPANIMVKEREPLHLKLGDFGLASKSDQLKTFCGTELYVAPELMAHQNYNNKVDLWSLGIMALQYSYGLPEYPRENAVAWPGKLAKHLGRCPDNLTIQFISSLLQIDPHNRPSAQQSLEHPYFSAQLNPVTETGPEQSKWVLSPLWEQSEESTVPNTPLSEQITQIFAPQEGLGSDAQHYHHNIGSSEQVDGVAAPHNGLVSTAVWLSDSHISCGNIPSSEQVTEAAALDAGLANNVLWYNTAHDSSSKLSTMRLNANPSGSHTSSVHGRHERVSRIPSSSGDYSESSSHAAPHSNDSDEEDDSTMLLAAGGVRMQQASLPAGSGGGNIAIFTGPSCSGRSGNEIRGTTGGPTTAESRVVQPGGSSEEAYDVDVPSFYGLHESTSTVKTKDFQSCQYEPHENHTAPGDIVRQSIEDQDNNVPAAVALRPEGPEAPGARKTRSSRNRVKRAAIRASSEKENAARVKSRSHSPRQKVKRERIK
ncbi:hypothetical protein NUW58_g4155 [Xylaria curta]|uniref:Uncharacterized protein n=1 Tax=Xylaria curta TaxID=42375 RepID=A0ACC1P7M3_9PEZI|nr:hypothetical protein NUW58_g4155 [Xylaria curta]